MINSPVTDRFARTTAVGNTTNGYRRLLQLHIPSEGILCRGWVASFSLQNKGFQEPAPTYSFNFFIAFDQMAENIGISHQIKKVYTQDDNVFASKAKSKPATIAPEPGERDFPERRPIIDIEEGAPGGRPR